MATETVIQQVGESPEIEAYRIGLLKSAKELENTDITEYAKTSLLNSGIKKVYIIFQSLLA